MLYSIPVAFPDFYSLSTTKIYLPEEIHQSRRRKCNMLSGQFPYILHIIRLEPRSFLLQIMYWCIWSFFRAPLSWSFFRATKIHAPPRPTRYGVLFCPCRPSLCTTQYNLRFLSRSLTASRLDRCGNGISHCSARHGGIRSRFFLVRNTATKERPILVASDSSHKDDYGFFGWAIGTKNEGIWDCQGIAQSCSMHSY
jgi:hypothetical protein